MDLGATSLALVMASHVLQMLVYGQLVGSRNIRQLLKEGAFWLQISTSLQLQKQA
jgi:hypothetical protein